MKIGRRRTKQCRFQMDFFLFIFDSFFLFFVLFLSYFFLFFLNFNLLDFQFPISPAVLFFFLNFSFFSFFPVSFFTVAPMWLD